jgi:hypothetical protein
VLGGVPLLVYVVYQRVRHQRSFEESARRAGLQLGASRYLALNGGVQTGFAEELLFRD